MKRISSRSFYTGILWLSILILAACARETQPAVVAAELDAPFTLNFGQTAEVAAAGLTVEFLEVTSDSRCPSDVNCVEAGRVTVLINVRGDGGAIGDYNLTLDHIAENAQAVTPDGFTIQLLEVSPYPVTTESIEPADYTATFRVSK